jgi:hypothetical protein
MTYESAAHYQLGAEPRFSLDILRSLRAEIDALLGFLQFDQGWRTPTMKHKSAGIQPDLFKQDQPRLSLLSQQEQLATLVGALLLEIAAVLASGEVGDDEDHG